MGCRQLLRSTASHFCCLTGNTIHRVPREVFEAEPRLSWVVNNAWLAEARQGAPLGGWEPNRRPVEAVAAKPLITSMSLSV